MQKKCKIDLLVSSISGIEIDSGTVGDIFDLIWENGERSWDIDGFVTCIKLFTVGNMKGIIKWWVQNSEDYQNQV